MKTNMEGFEIKLHKQKDFPLLEVFKQFFPVTNDTIFAYDHKIYSNNELPMNLIVHELTHHYQQDKYGLDEWVKKYLHNKEFRLRMEIEAYRVQLESVKNPNDRARILMYCAQDLSSSLYGNLITYDKALKALK